jgi:transaldolase
MNNLKIKLYADGANLTSMINLAKRDDIKGFTTNPTLMRKDGVQDYRAFAKEVLKAIPDKPISFEVFSDDLVEMEKQAKEIASWADNVYVKIPITNTKSESTIPIISTLSHAGVKVNVTAVFTLQQTLDAALALRYGCPSIVSIFAGRIADAGINPTPIMQAALATCASIEPNIELLWASPRELYNIIEANNVGCHIITVSHDLLNKMKLFGKDLTEFSLSTVQMFYNDAQKAGYSL